MATKAQNQITIVDLTDAYSVMLSMDAVALNGGVSTLGSSQSVTVYVSAYRGAEQLTPSVAAPTCPANVSASVGSAVSSRIPVTVTFAAALSAAGKVTIPVTVDDITVSKEFSYAIAFTGQTGGTGAAGRGISAQTTQYQTSSGGTTVPTGAWSDSVPSVSAGQYLWTRVTTSYTSGDPTYSYSVARTGTNGASVTVSSQSVTYAKSGSGTTAPADSAFTSSSPVATATGEYLWTKTVVTYSDGKSTKAYSVAAHGATGAKGDKGDTGDKGDKGDDGDDAILIAITSNNGVIFKNSSGTTTLTAHVYKGGAELTGNALSALGAVKWYKDGGSTAVGTGVTLTVTASGVSDKAVYEARLEG